MTDSTKPPSSAGNGAEHERAGAPERGRRESAADRQETVPSGENAETTASGRIESESAFPVVGIGASAGGLEALETLLSRLPRTGMAFVVIQHLAPGKDSHLSEILSRAARIPVT